MLDYFRELKINRQQSREKGNTQAKRKWRGTSEKREEIRERWQGLP